MYGCRHACESSAVSERSVHSERPHNNNNDNCFIVVTDTCRGMRVRDQRGRYRGDASLGNETVETSPSPGSPNRVRDVGSR